MDLARAVVFRSAALAAALAGALALASSATPGPPGAAVAARSRASARPIEIAAIPAARLTEWNPGIPGGIPARTKRCATAPEALGDGKVDAAPWIQQAIDACPEGQVVFLPPGTYRLTRHLVIPKGIVLRGAGPAQTRLHAEVQGTAVVYLTNLWPQYDDPPVDVTADVPKGAREIPVANAARFAVGDIVQIDQLDDPTYVYRGGLRWFIRGPSRGDDRRPVSREGYRCQGQTVEVVGKTASTLRIGTPIHLGFKRALRPQVYAPSGPRTFAGPIVRWAGLEDLYVTGGRAGMIRMIAAAYSWIRNVECDGSLTTGRGSVGHHVDLEACYRCVVRDSYVHDASDVTQGGGAYGISVNSQSSECLVENNVVVNLNKPLVAQASGGGNVIAYNYADDAWTRAAPRVQETTIDAGHAAFPHMELFEGNWAGHLGTDVVWGNSGWITFFRNYASGQQRRSRDAAESWDAAAIGLEARGVDLNVVANVLGAAGRPQAFEVTSSPPGTGREAVYRIGHRANGGGGTGDADRYEDPHRAGSTASTLLRHGNFDHATGRVRWDPHIRSRELPPSLYLVEKPPFFGSDPWPWVDPSGPEKLHVLPARRRFEELSRIAVGGRPTP